MIFQIRCELTVLDEADIPNCAYALERTSICRCLSFVFHNGKDIGLDYTMRGLRRSKTQRMKRELMLAYPRSNGVGVTLHPLAQWDLIDTPAPFELLWDDWISIYFSR